jgi:hypothetical protein
MQSRHFMRLGGVGYRPETYLACFTRRWPQVRACTTHFAPWFAQGSREQRLLEQEDVQSDDHGRDER